MSLSDFGSIALRRLLDEHADAVLATHAHRGDATALVERGALARVLRFLRDDPACGFAMLADLCAVDYLGMAGDADAAEKAMIQHLRNVHLTTLDAMGGRE